jgi:hypothetical protein
MAFSLRTPVSRHTKRLQHGVREANAGSALVMRFLPGDYSKRPSNGTLCLIEVVSGGLHLHAVATRSIRSVAIICRCRYRLRK